MRYPQGGGLTVERRTFRERIRMEAAEVFATGQDNATVTKELRVSVRSVQRWRRSWQEGGRQTLHSKGSAARPKRHVDHKRGDRRSFTWTDASLQPDSLSRHYADKLSKRQG
ncbi:MULTISPECIES: helix-turn-helix domain-containing protein [Streptomyces]|uniref:Helix-turn-helix domain-containing protein n=1 Tax=Streptomyces prasinus TaxID=67345 RepID=A0ABX6AP71_9ACTN|nr:helix-turn-helix domain-containing protein [Streptomyces prasinus]QEV04520.1 helix-turn-helix domain-containing protein [Streptomyces prasinus]